MTKKPYGKKKNARGFGTRQLSDAVAGLADPLLRRRGFAVREIITRWPAIVGEQLADQSCPERLVFPPTAGDDATLHIRVEGPLALELQHLAPLIIERINTFYGFRTVSRLALNQGPLPERKKVVTRVTRDLTADEQGELERSLSSVKDSQLRRALAALGTSIIASDG